MCGTHVNPSALQAFVSVFLTAPIYVFTEEQEVLFGGIQKLLGPGYVRLAQRR